MSDDRINVTIRNWDDTKKAKVTLPTSMRVRELVSTCQKNWSLPTGESYVLRNTKTQQQLQDSHTLSEAGVTNETEVQIFPILGGGLHE